MAEKRNKRKNKDGSWGKKTINGITYVRYRDPSGKDFYGKTEKEVREKIKKAGKAPKPKSGNVTFGGYVLKWIESQKNSIEMTTYISYLDAINARLINYDGYDLANVFLNDLTSDMFQNYLNSLATRYSLNSIKKAWGLIKRCVEYAEVKEDIRPLHLKSLIKMPAEANVAKKKKKIGVPTVEEIEHIYNEAYSTWGNGARRYGNGAYVVILIMYTGMRVSEAKGLQWKDVDLKNKEITISQSLARVRETDEDGKNHYFHEIKSAKTENSCRTIPLPDKAVETLEYFKKYRTSDDDFVCVKESTRKPYSNREIERTMKRIVDNSQCRDKTYTPHSLRHGYGSILLSEGVDIKVVAELLGHSDVSFTYNIYITAFEKDKHAAAEKLNNI